jgi:hypothetical protein
MPQEDPFITESPICVRFTDQELQAYFRPETDPTLVADINQHVFFGGCYQCFDRLNYWGRYANQPAIGLNSNENSLPTNPPATRTTPPAHQKVDPQFYEQFSRNVLAQISRIQQITDIVSQQQLQIARCTNWDVEVLNKLLANQLPMSEYIVLIRHLRQCSQCAQQFWHQLSLRKD